MRFYRQTLLSVCLVLPCVVFGQPVANNDDVSTPEDQAVVFSIVANDTDDNFFIDPASVDLDPSSPSTPDKSVSTPAGLFVVNGSGDVTFTPAPDFFGVATLFYNVSNDAPSPQLSNTATITVTVDAVNDPPVLSPINAKTLAVNSAGGPFYFTITDIDTAPLDLTVTGTSTDQLVIPDGNISIAHTAGSTWQLQLTTTAQAGEADISVNVDDGDNARDITFHVTVNAVNTPPAIAAVPDQTILRNSTTGPLDLGITDGETPLANLIVTAGTTNNTLVPVSRIALVYSAGTWTVDVAPVTGGIGEADITVAVYDGTVSVSTTFHLTVNPPPNTPPAIAVIPDQTILRNTSTGALALNITDAETPLADLLLTATTTNAALAPVPNIALVYGAGTWTVNVTPLNGQTGEADITVTVNDGALTASRTFHLSVNPPPNTPPAIAVIPDQTILRNTSTGALALNITDAETPLADLLLTATTTNAALAPVPNIALVYGAGTWTVNVTPLAGQTGEADITVTVNDGALTASRTFHLTVNPPPNTPPAIAVIPDQTILRNTSTGALALNITDAETPLANLLLTATTTNAALAPVPNIALVYGAGTWTVNVTPLNGQTGEADITVTVNDGALTASRTFHLTVNAPPNTPPVLAAIADRTIVEDTSTGTVTLNASDAETPTANLIITATSSNDLLVPDASVIITGGANPSFTISPLPNQSGTTIITVRVSDGALFVQRAFTLTVTAENDTPTISSISNQIINENAQTGPLAFSIFDQETPIASLVMTKLSTNTALVENAGVVLTSMGSQQSVNVIPRLNQNGQTTIRLRVSDGDKFSETDFIVQVVAVDDPPGIIPPAPFSVAEDLLSIPHPFTVSDADGLGGVIVTATSDAQAIIPDGNITLNESVPGSGNWTIRVQGAPDASGIANITITADDGTTLPVTTATFQVTVTPVNDPPTITTVGNVTIAEDGVTLALPFTVNDKETPAGSLLATGTSGSQALVQDANVVVSNGGGTSRSVVVTPVANANGSTTITLQVSDGTGGTATSSFTLNVTPVNDPPTISYSFANPQNINEDGNTGDLLFTVDDVDGSPGTLTVNRASTNTTLIPVANVVVTNGGGTSRTVRVTPVANGFGSSSITLTVSDGALMTAAPAFTVNVASVNDDPTISTILPQTISESTSTGLLSFTLTDQESLASLSVSATSSNPALVPNLPANLVLAGSGGSRTINVIPAFGVAGTSTITLTVTDPNMGTATSAFLLTVTDVDDAPTISAIADRSTNEDTPTPPIPFVIGDPDTPIASLTLSGSSSNTTVVPNENIVFGGTGTARTVTVTPGPDLFGVTIITVNVNDGTNTTSETFQLTVIAVNDAPTITAIADQTVNEDTPTGDLVFTIGDQETAATGLVVTAGSGNTTLVPNANIALGGTGVTRTIKVTPVANLSGIAVITVNVFDGTVTVSRTFQLTVNAVDDTPTITAIADQVLVEDTPSGALPFTIGDVDTPVGALSVTYASSNTTLIPTGNIVVGGTGAARDVTITPANNQTGTSTITLTVDDGTTSAFIEFLVTVTPVDDAPTITVITDRTINEDGQTGAINFTISDPETPNSALVVTGTSSNTTLVPNAPANIVLGGTTGTRNVNIVPAADQNGVTLITLVVSDGVNMTSRTFQVTVNAVNDLPVVTNQIPLTINESEPLTLSLAQLTIVDPDNVMADFTLFVSGGPNYGISGANTITPNPNFSGTLSVPVFVGDGTGFSAPYNVQISVTSTNDAPVITGQKSLTINEDQTIALQVTDVIVNDPDNVFPTDFTLIVLAGTNYTFSATTITPAADYNGTLTVNVRVNDGAADSPTFPLQITITPVNDPPVITAQSSLSLAEDTQLTLVAGNFTVVDPEPVPYTLTVSPAPPGADYTVSGNTITPTPDFFGTLIVPVTVNDGIVSSAVFNATVIVTPVNDAPVIINQSSLSTVEDIPLELTPADLVVTDIDTPGYPTGFILSIQPGTNYTFVGTTITPSLDFVGTLQVSVRISDGALLSAPYMLQIEVTDDADAPLITGQVAVSFFEDSEFEITKDHLVIEDPDTDPSLLVLTVLPGTNYTFAGNVVRPLANFFGTLTVNVRVNDGEANSPNFPLQVSITPVNDPPSFNTINPVTMLEDAAQMTITVTGISPGPLETQQLSLTVQTDNTGLIPQPSVVYNGTAATASITFKPTPNAFGVATIKVTLLDTDLSAAERTFTITVTSVNDAPTLDAIAVDPIIEDAGEQIIPLTGISPGGGPPEAGQTLSFTPSADPSDLFEVFNVDYTSGTTGSLRIKPKPDAFGTVQVTVRLQDSGDGAAPNVNFTARVFNLVITPVNDLPRFISTPPKLTEPGALYEYNIEVVDVDGDVITLTTPTLPAWLTFTAGTNGKGKLSGTPPPGTSGDVAVGLFARDPSNELIDGSYVISVNSRPVVTPIALTINEDEPHTYKAAEFSAGFSDADGNPLAELQITKLPEKGKLTGVAGDVKAGDKIPLAEIASLVYTPARDVNGVDVFRWNASDGFFLYGLIDTEARITILPINDMPVVTVEDDTLKYELGSEVPVFLTPLFTVTDPDGDNLASAELGFKGLDNFQFRPLNEMLTYTNTAKITALYEEPTGKLRITGIATAAEYQEFIRNIKYNYINATELLLDTRSVYVAVSDGVAPSLQDARIITLIYTFSDLVIPKAFTPNPDDEVNRTWQITSANGTDQYGNAEIKVYNKRGLLLFETKGFDKPWDGVFNGSVLPSDTYFYTIDLHYNRVRYKGTVTILR